MDASAAPSSRRGRPEMITVITGGPMAARARTYWLCADGRLRESTSPCRISEKEKNTEIVRFRERETERGVREIERERDSQREWEEGAKEKDIVREGMGEGDIVRVRRRERGREGVVCVRERERVRVCVSGRSEMLITGRNEIS